MNKKSWMNRVLVVTIFVFVTCLAGSKAIGEPVFNADGSITCGEKQVSLDKSGYLSIETPLMQFKFRRCFFEIDPQTKEWRRKGSLSPLRQPLIGRLFHRER